MTRSIGPLLPLLAVACTCERPPAASVAAPALGPIERPEALRGEALRVAAVDARRALVVARDGVGQPARVALVEDGAPRWERGLPCDPDYLGRLGVTVDPRLSTLRCVSRRALFTFALGTSDGELAWTASAELGQEPLDRISFGSLRIGGVLIEHVVPLGVVAYDRAGGRELFTRASNAYHVLAIGEHLAVEEISGVEVLDPRSGRSLRTIDDLLGAIPGGACARGEAGLERVSVDGGREVLVSPEVLASLPARDPRLVTRCGRRGARTVLLVDLDASVLALVAERDRLVHQLRLPATSGPPAVAGWDRELPRFIPLVTRADDLYVIDLDDGAVRSAHRLPGGVGPRAFGEIVALRARVGDRFLFSYESRLVALDGATGELVADDAPARNDGWWLDVEDAVHADGVFVPRDGGDGRLAIAPAALRGDAELLRRFSPIAGE